MDAPAQPTHATHARIWASTPTAHTLTDAHVHAQGFELHPLPDLPLAAPRLTKLVLSHLDLHGSFFTPLAACSSLRSLVMRSVDFKGPAVTASLHDLAGLPELDLELTDVYGLRYGNLAAGPLVQAITSLDINRLWEDTRELVSSLRKARHISIQHECSQASRLRYTTLMYVTYMGDMYV